MPATIFLMMVERRAGHFGWLAAQSADILRSEKTTLERRRGGGGGVGEGGREGGREGREGGREKKHVNTVV